MKTAIASSGKDLNSQISDRAGRSPYFLIVEGKEISEVIRNPFAFGGGGVGFAVAKMLSDMGVSKLIAKNVGENMALALEERGIKLIESEGSAKEAFASVEDII